ncbi:MAG: membrane protein insertion efficiency factor YidD [Gammaproteobacteria bacterium RIFCSPHIGHO2_12_FULL_45_12]|nr:MAG: membrane protein insertion efficiency factor YidD [Gammaproteobacteria bacterium RIFCSPHIGHO2_12_FULL_45_12]
MAALHSFLTVCLIRLIRLYRYVFSLLLGPCCRFEPSCSAYAMEAITLHGCLKGGALACGRLLRCHPWCPGGFDPVRQPGQPAPKTQKLPFKFIK